MAQLATLDAKLAVALDTHAALESASSDTDALDTVCGHTGTASCGQYIQKRALLVWHAY